MREWASKQQYKQFSIQQIAVRKPKVSHYLIGFPTIKSSLL